MSIVYVSDRFGISFADVTTGDYFVTEVDSVRKLLDEICKFSPREIVCNEALVMSGIDTEELKERLGITLYSLENWYFDDELCRRGLLEHFQVKSMEGLGVGGSWLRSDRSGSASPVPDRDPEDLPESSDQASALCVGKFYAY